MPIRKKAGGCIDTQHLPPLKIIDYLLALVNNRLVLVSFVGGAARLKTTASASARESERAYLAAFAPPWVVIKLFITLARRHSPSRCTEKTLSGSTSHTSEKVLEIFHESNWRNKKFLIHTRGQKISQWTIPGYNLKVKLFIFLYKIWRKQ